MRKGLGSLIRHMYERSVSMIGFLLMLMVFGASGVMAQDARTPLRELESADRGEISNRAWRVEGTEWLSRKSTEITKTLKDAGIQHVTVYNRMKSEESAKEKADRRGVSITDLNDLYGMRVVVNNELDVYHCLNLICDRYPVVPGTMKNYIVSPKASGYQSVHVVTEIDERRVEFQLRTEAMHLSAEAEHEAYKARMRAAA